MLPFDFDVVSRQQWSNDTLLILAERFLEGGGLLGEFEDYLEGVAAGENEECSAEGVNASENEGGDA